MSTFSTIQGEVEALYVGYFQRPGDPTGEQYWENQLVNGTSWLTAAASFSVQLEAQNDYPFLATDGTTNVTNIQNFITQVYQDLFNRAPDAAGLAYWTAQLQAAHTPAAIGEMILNIISGAPTGSADDITLQNKVAVASFITNTAGADGLSWTPGLQAEATALVGATTNGSSSVATEEAAWTAYVAANPISLTSNHDNTHTVNEGQGVAFTITGGTPGEQLTYTITGDSIHPGFSGADISGGGAATFGTVTLDASGSAVVHVGVLADNITEGPEDMVFSVTTPGGTLSDTLTINDTSTTPALNISLTTNTDTITTANSLPTENGYAPPNGNVINAQATASLLGGVISTLGQNDMIDLTGTTGNTLNLSTSGVNLGPVLINSFTVKGVQTFDIQANANIGAGGAGGTVIDMSSVAVGAGNLTTVIDDNSSGSLALNNVGGLLQSIVIQNSSDLTFGGGGPVDLTVNYDAAVVNPANGPYTQNVTLSGTLSPVTGLPETTLSIGGINEIVINSTGGVANNGLSAITDAALSNLTVVGVPGLVMTKLAFGGAGTIDLTGLTGTYFDDGHGGATPSILAGGALTINGGAGGMNATFTPVGSGTPQTGGGVKATSATINLGAGNFLGQQVDTSAGGTGGTITVQGLTNGVAGGFLDNAAQATTLTTDGGNVVIGGANGFNGGFGSVGVGAHGGATIKTAKSSSLTDGNVTISNVNGGIFTAFNTGLTADLASGQVTVNEAGATGNITLDFSLAGTSGFHANHLVAPASNLDTFIGGTGTNTLLIDPSINNAASTQGEGQASGVQVITLQSPANTAWTTGAVDLGPLNQNASFTGINTGNVQTVNINVSLAGAAAPTFVNAVSGDSFVADVSKTLALTGQKFTFDYNGTTGNTLNLTLNNTGANGGAGGQALSVADFAVNPLASQNPVTTLAFTANTGPAVAGNSGNVALTIDTMNSLATLDLLGTANLVLADTATQAASISTIDGHSDNANIDLRGLMTVLSTGGYPNAGNGAADALAAAGGTISLGSGNDFVAVGNGSWTITAASHSGVGATVDTIVATPTFGDTDVITTGAGNDQILIGINGAGGGGIVNISAGAGNDTITFDNSGAVPQLTSADSIDGGAGTDTVVLIGALNQNDSLFANWTSVEQLQFAGGVNNSIMLNSLANNSGLTTIITSGVGASNVIAEGAGFTNPLTVNVANGDTGGDAILSNPTSGNLTVNASVTGFNEAFESASSTAANNPNTGLPANEGIFANAGATNVLDLTADGTTAAIFGTATQGLNNVQTIMGVSGGIGVAENVSLLNSPAGLLTIDLSAVQGSTTVLASANTSGLTIKGGTEATGTPLDILVGGTGNDTIVGGAVVSATTPGVTITDVLYGGLGADTLTGVQGGLNNNSGTEFVFNSVAESIGDSITNFHSATDILDINPASLSLGGIVFVGSASNYAGALALLGGAHAENQAVYETDTDTLWIDANNDGNLNSSDYQIHITFASPVLTGANFSTSNPTGGLLTFGGTYPNPTITIGTPTVVSGNPGPVLVATAPNNTLQLETGADIQNTTLIGFNGGNLVIDNTGTTSVDMTVAQWDMFFPGNFTNTTDANNTTIQFTGAGGSFTTTDLQETSGTKHYDPGVYTYDLGFAHQSYNGSYVGEYDASSATSAVTVTLGTTWNFANPFSNTNTDLNANSQTFDGSAFGDTVIAGGLTLTGTYAFGAGANTLEVANGSDLHAATISATSGTLVLDMTTAAGSTVTMTSGQEALFDTGGAMVAPLSSSNVINITDNGSTVNLDSNETVVGQVNIQANTTTVSVNVGNGIAGQAGWDHTLNLGSTTSDVIDLSNGTPGLSSASGSDLTHYATILGFDTSTDKLDLTLDGNHQTPYYGPITTSTNESGHGPNAIIDIASTFGTLVPNQAASASTVEAYINSAVTHLAVGNDTFVITDAAGDSLIYEGHVHSTGGGNSQVNNIDLVGVIVGVHSEALTSGVFV